jgi:hypothetical protein
MKKLVSILVHAQSENKSESVNLTAGETVINPQSSKFVEHYLNAHSTLAEKTMLYRQCRKSQKAHTPRKEAVLRYGLFRKFVVLMYHYGMPCPTLRTVVKHEEPLPEVVTNVIIDSVYFHSQGFDTRRMPRHIVNQVDVLLALGDKYFLRPCVDGSVSFYNLSKGSFGKVDAQSVQLVGLLLTAMDKHLSDDEIMSALKGIAKNEFYLFV